VLQDVKLSIAGSVVRFAETHPSDDAELAEVIGLVHGEATSTAA